MSGRGPYGSQLSLIPYHSGVGEVVLRHGNAIVTIDQASQQMTLRHEQDDSTFDFDACPYCKRPFDVDTSTNNPATPGDHAFVKPDYFRLLAESFAATPGASRAQSSTRPLRALRSGESRNVSASGPPTGASSRTETEHPASRAEHTIKTTSFLQGYFKQFFIERGELGKGGRGVVLLVEHVLDDISLGQFACKRIPVGNDHDWLVKILNEVQLLQRLIHPNLVAYRHVWLEDAQPTKFGPPVPCIFILQQYCNAGDLHQYIQSLNEDRDESLLMRRRGSRVDTTSMMQKYLPLDDMLQFFGDITAGLDYLHNNGWVHRDLKPSNCLLSRSAGRLTLLVSDFGEVQATGEQRTSTGATGTISYCAPEVLRPDGADGRLGAFTTKSDIFSLGMILYYMCFARLPYINARLDEENEDLDRLRAEITSWSGFDSISLQRADLPPSFGLILSRLLSVDPDLRPTTTDILSTAASVRAGSFASTAQPPIKSPTIPPRSPRRKGRRSSSHRSPPFSRQMTPTQGISDGTLALRGPRHTAPDDAIASENDTESPRDHSDHPDSSRPLQQDNLILRPGDKRDSSTSSDTRISRSKSALVVSKHRSPRTIHNPPGRRLQAPHWLGGPPLSLEAKAAVFLARALSLTYPCLPYAVRPAIVVPLLGLAAMELLVGASWRVTMLLILVHVGALIFIQTFAGGICARSAYPAENDFFQWRR